MRRMLVVLMLTLLLLLSASPVLAQEGGGKVLFGQDFTLESGETWNGDLALLGGNLTLEEGSLVNGDVAVMGGNAYIAGKVNGDVAVFGNVKLKETAHITGDLAVLGHLLREEGAVVKGQLMEVPHFFPRTSHWKWVFRVPGLEIPPFPSWDWLLYGTVNRAFQWLISTLALMALGVLLILFLPRQVAQVGNTVISSPLNSVGVGLLTGLAAGAIGLFLVVTICLSLFGILTWLATFAAGLFGWIALGSLTGERVMKAINAEATNPVLNVAMGILILSLLGSVPCVGFVINLGLGLLGLGAVVLTRFGTQPYPLESPPAPPAPVETPPPAGPGEEPTSPPETSSPPSNEE